MGWLSYAIFARQEKKHVGNGGTKPDRELETRWGSRSSQLKAFDDAQTVRVTLPQAQHLEVRMHQQLEALQGLDPGRPLFRAAKVGLTPK